MPEPIKALVAVAAIKNSRLENIHLLPNSVEVETSKKPMANGTVYLLAHETPCTWIIVSIGVGLFSSPKSGVVGWVRQRSAAPKF
jgi:hypothetical protein